MYGRDWLWSRSCFECPHNFYGVASVLKFSCSCHLKQNISLDKYGCAEQLPCRIQDFGVPCPTRIKAWSFFSEVSCFIKFRTTSTLFSGMFWLGCYSCSCCDGNRIKSTPCSQTWTRTRTKQQFFLIFPYPYSKRLKPNWESTKRGISGSRIPKKVLPSEEGFTKKLRSLLRVPGLSEKKFLNCYYVLYLQEFSIAFYFQTIMYYAYRNFYLLFTAKSEHL